jgi:hypothetical protein
MPVCLENKIRFYTVYFIAYLHTHIIFSIDVVVISLGVRERERSLLNMYPRQSTSSLTKLFLARSGEPACPSILAYDMATSFLIFMFVLHIINQNTN